MISYVNEMVRAHRETGLLIDTNILLMLVVGSYDRSRIGTFKRTEQYTEDDFDIAISVIKTAK